MKAFNFNHYNPSYYDCSYYIKDGGLVWTTDFDATENEDIMHGRYCDPPPMPMPTDLVRNDTSETPAIVKHFNRVRPMRYAAYERSSWRLIEPFKLLSSLAENPEEMKKRGSVKVYWGGFEATIDDLLTCGWQIDLELNRFTKRHKLVFKNINDGLMVRVPYDIKQDYVSLPALFAVKNYKMKAAKHTEIVAELSKDMIPELLTWIREEMKDEVSELAWEQHKEKLAKKVIQFSEYLTKKVEKPLDNFKLLKYNYCSLEVLKFLSTN